MPHQDARLDVAADGSWIQEDNIKFEINSYDTYAVEEALRGQNRKPLRREGESDAQWVLLDYGDIVVHVFDTPTRDYYDLERLWGDAPRLDPGLTERETVSEG